MTRMEAELVEVPRWLVDQAIAALTPFAECCDTIEDDESDDEWAKFRLLI